MKEKTKLNKIHYVCMGCRIIFKEYGKCTTAGCPRHRNPLNECRCKNGKHSKVPRLNAAGFAIKK